MKRLLAIAGAIGALTYFFDPTSGRRRRKLALDRTAASTSSSRVTGRIRFAAR